MQIHTFCLPTVVTTKNTKMMQHVILSFLVFASSAFTGNAFTALPPHIQSQQSESIHHIGGSARSATADSEASSSFKVTVDLPGASEFQATLNIEPVLSVPSEIIEVRYKLPFGLSVEPQKGLAVCTKDGTGGEQVGDVLRYSSQWTLGLPQGGGLITSAAAFSGGLSWQCSLFNVLQATQWEQVVEALTSNVPDRTDEVVLIFERPLSDSAQ